MSPTRTRAAAPRPEQRADVLKTYKLYIGGGFARSESGRSYEVQDSKGRFLANAAAASRKDARDAVAKALAAQPGWAATTAYNRGQVLYRVAEVMQSRADQFIAEVVRAEGISRARAQTVVAAAIDRWVWYAGWTDKLAQVAGNLNPVAGPYFNISAPEPVGVVAVIAPQASSLLGLVEVLAPVLVPGNAAVVLASHRRPVPAVTLAEVLATSDLPGGVVNVLTGDPGETAPWLAAHEDVNALDLTGAAETVRPNASGLKASGLDATGLDATDLEVRAAQTLTRVVRPPVREPDWAREPDGPHRMLRFTETKTVWHPKGR